MLPSLLLERDAELAAITKVMGRAMAGRGSLLAVTGPSGIGKSRLLAHARNRAVVSGWRILDCRLTPLSGDVAHGVLWSWFGDLVRRGSAGVHPFDGPGAALTDFCAGRTRTVADLVYATRWLLEEISSDQAVLLLVDDLEHADAGSREVLELLAPALAALPCVLAYAVEEVADAPPRLLDASQQLALRPLQAGGTASLVRSARPDLSDADAARLHHDSGGVPLVLHELLAGGLPDTTQGDGVVGSRVRALPERLLETARVVALLADDVAVALVAALVGRAEDAVADDFEELADRRVLWVDGGLVRVRHPLVAEALTRDLEPEQRAAWHSLIAAALRERDTHADLVAAHLLRARASHDPRARELLARQGRRALHAGNPALAGQLLDRALAEDAEDAEDATRVDLLAASARARAEAGLVEEAVALWDRAATASDAATGDALRIQAASALTFAGRSEEARQRYDVLLGGRPHDRAWRRLAARASLACLVQGTEPPAGTVGLPAPEDLAETATDPEDGFALTTVAAVHALQGGDAGECRTAALRGLATGFVLAEEANPGPLWLAAGVLAWTGAFQEGETIFSEAIAVAQDHGSTMTFVQRSSCRGYLRTRMGLVREAMFDLEVAVRASARAAQGVPGSQRADYAAALASLVECHIARGELELAAACAEPLATLARTPGLVGAVALQALGDLAATAGDDEGALRHYTQVGERMRNRIDNPAVLAWRIGAALSLVRLGRVPEAVELGREDLRLSEEFGAPFAIAQALRTVAVVDPTVDRVQLLRQALAVLADTPAPRLAAQIATDLAGMLVLAGGADEEEVVGLLRSAEEYAGEQELRPLQDRARRLLARLGQSARRSRTEAVAALTSAERRVAQLAAEGLTNRQIAQQLFVTIKAVEWHLSNTYRKLGIRTRNRLPALFGES